MAIDPLETTNGAFDNAGSYVSAGAHHGENALPEHSASLQDGISQQDEAQSDHPLARRARKVCSLKINEELLACLDAHTSSFAASDQKNRVTLQAELEKDVVVQHRRFKGEMETMLQRMEEENGHIESVHEVVTSKVEELKILKENSKPFLEASRVLDSEIKCIDTKLKIARLFMTRFTLSPRECEQLTGVGGPERSLSKEFFDALRRTHAIREDCKQILRLQPGSQVLGLQLMESTGRLQEAGYQRLYRWCLDECRKLVSETPAVTPSLCEALGMLATRSAVLSTVLDEYALIRKSYISGSFVGALTQGSSTSSRPLELYSYDPLRYMTDLLGWIHQAVTSEKDSWISLARDIPVQTQNEHLPRVFSTMMEGLVWPLKPRLDRVVESNPGPVVLYKIHHWIDFYVGKIRYSISLHNSDNPLLALLVETSSTLHNQYLISLRNLAAQVGRKVEIPADSLEPAPALTVVLNLLRELILCQQSLHGHEPNHPSDEDAGTVISIVLEPLLQMCNESASHVTPNIPTAMAIYLLNCLHMIRTTLFTGDQSAKTRSPRGELLARQCDAHVDILVTETVNTVLREVRMRPLLDMLRLPEESRILSDDREVEQFLIFFDQYLANPDDFTLKELRLLLSTQMKNSITQTSHRLIVDFYKQIYPILTASKFTSSVKTPDVVQRLFMA